MDGIGGSFGDRARIRVARIYTTLETGGIAVRLLDLLPRMDPDRFELHVIYIKREGGITGAFREKGIPVHACRCHGRLPFPPSTRRLAALLASLRIGIVHAHTVIPALFATAAARIAGIPVVIANYHNVDSIPLARQIWLERHQSRSREASVHVSEAVRDDYLRRVRPFNTTSLVLRNGVDIPRFAGEPDPDRIARLRRELGLGGGGPVILSIGRLHPNKAPLDVLRAFSLALPGHPGAVLVMAGGGRERGAVEGQADRLGIRDRVRILGERSDVRELLHLSDVHVLASVKEGFCNAVLESMAAGRPQVLTDLDGNREALGDSGAALLSPPRRPDLLAANLLAILDDPSRAAEMGRAARRRVLRFPVERQVAETEGLYDALAPAAGPRAGRAYAAITMGITARRSPAPNLLPARDD